MSKFQAGLPPFIGAFSSFQIINFRFGLSQSESSAVSWLTAQARVCFIMKTNVIECCKFDQRFYVYTSFTESTTWPRRKRVNQLLLGKLMEPVLLFMPAKQNKLLGDFGAASSFDILTENLSCKNCSVHELTWGRG